MESTALELWLTQEEKHDYHCHFQKCLGQVRHKFIQSASCFDLSAFWTLKTILFVRSVSYPVQPPEIRLKQLSKPRKDAEFSTSRSLRSHKVTSAYSFKINLLFLVIKRCNHYRSHSEIYQIVSGAAGISRKVLVYHNSAHKPIAVKRPTYILPIRR